MIPGGSWFRRNAEDAFSFAVVIQAISGLNFEICGIFAERLQFDAAIVGLVGNQLFPLQGLGEFGLEFLVFTLLWDRRGKNHKPD